MNFVYEISEPIVEPVTLEEAKNHLRLSRDFTDDDELIKKLKSAKRIALYRSFKGEVPVDGLAKSFMEKGITCCFPRVEDNDMVFCDCVSLGKDEFEESPLGIREPLSSKEPVDPKDIDVVVLPAVAYNEEGTRLGMGGGFYDRFISSSGSDRPYLLGICYEFQICADIMTFRGHIRTDLELIADA